MDFPWRAETSVIRSWQLVGLRRRGLEERVLLDRVFKLISGKLKSPINITERDARDLR